VFVDGEDLNKFNSQINKRLASFISAACVVIGYKTKITHFNT
jgi:hypothetical protein